MKVEEGNALIGATLTSGRDTIFLASHEGMAIRFPESDVRDIGRRLTRIYAMDLEKGDYIVGMKEIVSDKELILSVSEKGYGKRTAITEYRLQSRAGKGVINLKTVERNGKVVGVSSVSEEWDADQPAGQDYSPGCQHHPRIGPFRAGSKAD